MDTLGIWVGAILTLLVFSYLLGDSPLFRLAQAVFVGVAIGYAVIVTVTLVLLPRLFEPLLENPIAHWHLFVPLVLGALLLLKIRTEWSSLGNISIAFLFGVGAALAIGGALSGVLLPQLSATIVNLTPSQNVDTFGTNFVLAFGTIGALLSFRFVTAQKHPGGRALDLLARGWSYFGRWFILIAFGAIFADTTVSRVTILINRVYFLLHDWLGLVP